MVLMGINRIVVTDGKIQAKVMYDFQARDNFHYQNSATQFDYGDQYRSTQAGTIDSGVTGGETSGKEGTDSYDKRDGSWYSKGQYQNTQEPVLKLVSASTTTADASLQTKASLAGNVDINFKSDYLPLEKMADSFQIAAIQNAAQPKRPAAAAAGTRCRAAAAGRHTTRRSTARRTAASGAATRQR